MHLDANATLKKYHPSAPTISEQLNTTTTMHKAGATTCIGAPRCPPLTRLPTLPVVPMQHDMHAVPAACPTSAARHAGAAASQTHGQQQQMPYGVAQYWSNLGRNGRLHCQARFQQWARQPWYGQ